MKIALILCALMFAIPSFAGTFRDDFEDGNWAGWEIFPDIRERFSIINGVMRLDNLNKPEFGVNLHIMGNKWRDYSFSTDMRIVEVEPNAWAGGAVFLRWDRDIGPFEDYTLFGAVINGWNARCNTERNGNIDTVWNINLPIASPQVGTWYRVEIKAIGNEISFYVNNKLQHKQKDDRHQKGGTGCIALYAIVEYDNVVIEGPDIPDIGPSGFGVCSANKLTITWGQLRSLK